MKFVKRPFVERPNCPKCLSTAKLVAFHNGVSECTCEDNTQHLLWHCNACTYTWTSFCADADTTLSKGCAQEKGANTKSAEKENSISVWK